MGNAVVDGLRARCCAKLRSTWRAGADGDRPMSCVAGALGPHGRRVQRDGRGAQAGRAGTPAGWLSGVLRVQCHGRRARALTRRPATSPIHRHVTVSDVGKAINPLQVEMQDEGAAIMGLGHTLMEHYIFDDAGRIRNLGAIDYRIPTSMDLPEEMRSRHRREPGRARALRRQGHVRGCVAGGRVGCRRRRARRDRRRDQGPAPVARARMARAPGDSGGRRYRFKPEITGTGTRRCARSGLVVVAVALVLDRVEAHVRDVPLVSPGGRTGERRRARVRVPGQLRFDAVGR